jgi:UDP-N-acetylglucosamine--N-acetylmuramyl-(pentapeptide) pyrophosphoryl-undecaprenol N-acetylglucosamine transferase
MKKIILTGGGTAGHVTPNIALVKELQNKGFEILYIGSKNGIEKDIVTKNNIKYTGISSGKFRRYISFKNATDMFRIVKGLGQAILIMKKENPNIVFSKGGFVTVPVVLAAKLCKIPIIIHESDITPGLANKIAIPHANVVCSSFIETLEYLPKGRSEMTGPPIRDDIFLGNKEKGFKQCSFNAEKPVLLVTGGSLGSNIINRFVRLSLLELLKKYQVVHICGKGNVDTSINLDGYIQFEYSSETLKDLLAIAHIVISRAGANFIYEFLALQKLNILVPLSKKASRGDQILNAKSFEKQGLSYVLDEENLNEKSLLEALLHVEDNKKNYLAAMSKTDFKNGVENIINIIMREAL